MSEPTEAVYEAAYEAFKRAPLGASIVRACVDAVWPLAEARGYQQAIAELDGVFARTGSPAARWAADYLEVIAKERTP
jgi:hypothetical protein